MVDTAAHDQQSTIVEIVEYPEHVQRTESIEFARNRRLLLKQLGLGCRVCGSKQKLEIHHWAVEWSLWECADPDKLITLFHQVDWYGFGKDMGETPVTSPDDKRNLLVLCGEHQVGDVVVPGGHHRGVELGTHHLSGPIFFSAMIAKDGVQITRIIEAHKAGLADAPTDAPATT